MHVYLLALLGDRFGPERLREIHFQELVNYLRLIPYKRRRAPEVALAFFACASELLRRYLEAGGRREVVGFEEGRHAIG